MRWCPIIVAISMIGCAKSQHKEMATGKTNQSSETNPDVAERIPSDMSEAELRKEYAKYLDELDKVNLLAAEICTDEKNRDAAFKYWSVAGSLTPLCLPEDPRTLQWVSMEGELANKSKRFRNQWASLGLNVPEFKPLGLKK